MEECWGQKRGSPASGWKEDMNKRKKHLPPTEPIGNIGRFLGEKEQQKTARDTWEKQERAIGKDTSKIFKHPITGEKKGPADEHFFRGRSEGVARTDTLSFQGADDGRQV